MAFALALNVPVGDWQDDVPAVPIAVGILLAVLAGGIGGVLAGLVAAAVGWGLNWLFLADDSLEALLALPAWLAAGAVAGWLAKGLRRSALDVRQLAIVRAAGGDAIVAVDGNGAIADWSPSMQAVYGYERKEVEDRPLVDLFAGPDAADRSQRFLETIERGDRIADEEETQIRRDGTTFAAAVTLVPTGSDGAVLLVRDLSALRAAEERFRDSEAKYRSLTEHLPVVTYIRSVDGDRTPIYVSPQIDRLAGYTAEEWLRDPELLLRLVHADDRERVRAELARPAQGQPLRTEYRVLARDGRTVWVRDEAVTLLDARGRPLCIQGFLADVSDRRTADDDRKRLRAAEATANAVALDRQRKADFIAKAAAVLASSLDYRATIEEVAALAVRELADWCVVDRLEEDGTLTRLAAERAESSEAKAEVGAEPGEDVLEVVTSRRPHLSDSRIAVPLVSHGGRTLGALTLVAGTHRRTFTSDDLSWAEALAGMAALAIDTARMHDEVEARADAARVLTYVGDGVFLVDRTGIIRLWNPMAEAITALPAESVLGRTAIEAIPAWDQISERVPIAAAREPAGAATLPLETERGERWISISGVEFFGGTVYAFRDITDAHLLDELQAEFIATASHELRTPLAAVYGAAQTLRRHDFALDEAGRARFITLIVEESERLGRIVNQILLANQLDVGRLDLVTEPFDAVELLERVAEAARTHVPAQIRLVVAPAEGVPPVAADKDRVRQILVNLVENAIKYSPDGGTIELGVESIEGMLLFRVLDEGLGIPDEEHPRIFEKFYRLDPGMTRGIGGTGLGLYICSELVERMGGRIWVESRKGKGSAFYFELPSVGTARLPVRPRDASGVERAGP